jgi:hypothetical protein
MKFSAFFNLYPTALQTTFFPTCGMFDSQKYFLFLNPEQLRKVSPIRDPEKVTRGTVIEVPDPNGRLFARLIVMLERRSSSGEPKYHRRFESPQPLADQSP